MDARADYAQFLGAFMKAMTSSEVKNVFFSPISIFICVSFLLGGLGKISEKETLALLSPTTNPNIPAEVNAFQARVAELMINVLKSEDKLVSISNGLFVDENFELYDTFIEKSQKYFFTSPKSLDYKQNPDSARKYINKWVEDHTDNMIKDLLGPKVVDSDTKLILVNTILFIGKWMNAFDKERTLLNQEFKSFDDKVVSNSVSMMLKRNSKFHYFSNDNFQSLSLFYSTTSSDKALSSDFKITFLKPTKNTKEDLEALESQFRDKGLSIFAQERSTEIGILKIPKFTLEHELPLKKILEKLGMKSIFNEETADLSKVSPESEGLFVSDAIHKARIEVDEAGTKAAAATAIVMVMKSAAFHPEMPKPNFILDSPFIFSITHVPTNSVLFYGKIVDL